MRFLPRVLLACWGLTALGAAGAAFVLPWDDASGGVTDASGMNRPIGEGLRVGVDAAGHFRAGGERVRFLGVNFAGDSPFMPTNKAAGVAARLAKFGVNCVRFHHLDAPWATGGGLLRYSTTTSRTLNTNQLERIQYLVARLRERGVYANLNLVTGREYRSGDGLGTAVTSLDSKVQHVLACFDDTALDLQKEYATRFLGAANRFTGVPLAKDPGVAFVEVLNENGLLQQWYGGALDTLPAPYAGRLQGRWNGWLATCYADDAALRVGWNAVDEPLGTNRLRNGTFGSGVTGWTLEQHNGATATAVRTSEYNGGPSLKLTVTKVGTESWHVQFNQAGLRLTGGQVYTVTFSARASVAGPLDVSVMMAHDPWQGLGLIDTVSLSTNWQTFTRTFVAQATDANARVNFGGVGTRLMSAWLADVRLQSGGAVGVLPAGTSLAARSVPNLAHGSSGFTGTEAARRDWVRFTIEMENRYYDAMVGHLRTNVGYAGLIFGTIMANSPAAVQSRLDVIDAHAYWQHPVFPGVAWDSTNWYVPNVSMVNAAPGSTALAGLARQRIRGKPFTVTEYQHASPNAYGAEGPLLLAAYAALQDWDGIWLFDYGWGNDATVAGDTAPMGKVRGYFDTGQHPAKMANLRLAANLFRRGDVRPAERELTMALRPDTELDLLLRRAGAWSVFSSSQLDVPGGLALVNRLSVDYGPASTGLPTVPSAPDTFASDTGELNWRVSTNAGLVTVVSARTRAAVGWIAGKTVTLGDVEIGGGTNRLGWATVGLSLVAGDAFANGGRALLVGTGWAENTGQVWKTAEHNSLTSWGTAPTLVETVPLAVTLPVPRARVQAWVLDERGQRRSTARVDTDGAGRAVVVTQSNDATLWYEVEIAAAAVSGFEQWRREQFTPEEQLREEVSGPGASPAADGVANVVKYVLGLPPKRAVASKDLTKWGVAESSRGRTLWLSYPRRKAATDVRVTPYFSASLPEWREVTQVSGVDAGEFEVLRAEQWVADGSGPLGLMKLVVAGPGG